MELKFNEAKTVRPNHLERCLCYDKFLKGYRCYVYDDISKYWCTQATTEHDPNGDNHIVDYADYQVTKWASLPKIEQPSLPSDLDEAAEKNFETMEVLEHENIFEETHRKIFKAGAEWMAGQGVTREVEVKEDAGGYPYIDKHFELYDYDKDEPLFKAGDKVVVQIRKK